MALQVKSERKLMKKASKMYFHKVKKAFPGVKLRLKIGELDKKDEYFIGDIEEKTGWFSGRTQVAMIAQQLDQIQTPVWKPYPGIKIKNQDQLLIRLLVADKKQVLLTRDDRGYYTEEEANKLHEIIVEVAKFIHNHIPNRVAIVTNLGDRKGNAKVLFE